MKRILIGLVVIIALVIGWRAAPAFAGSLVAASDKLTTVSQDTTVDGAAYLAGESITVAGVVKGDVYCVGKDIVISGTVDGDVMCAGQTITLSGVVHGDVRLAGSDLVVKGTIDGSASLAGANITSEATATVGRDMTVAGGTVNLSGKVTRDVLAAGSNVNLGGSIGRDVKGDIGQLTIATTAKVGGMVEYTSDREATLPAGAVAGSVTRIEPSERSYFGRSRLSLDTVMLYVFMMIVAFVLMAGIVALIAPRYIERVSAATGFTGFGKFFLVGLASIMVVPMVLLLLLVSGVGVYASFVLGLSFTVVLMVSPVFMSYRLGTFMLSKQKVFLSTVVGATALGVLCFIPFIGWLIGLVAVGVGTGMVILGFRDQQLPNAAPIEKAKKANTKPLK